MAGREMKPRKPGKTLISVLIERQKRLFTPLGEFMEEMRPPIARASMERHVKENKARGELRKALLNLSSRNKEKRWQALAYFELFQRPGVAVRPLIMVLRKEPTVRGRESAARALGKLGDAHAIKPLVKALKEDEYFDVQVRAATALGKIALANARPGMEEALKKAAKELTGHTGIVIYALWAGKIPEKEWRQRGYFKIIAEQAKKVTLDEIVEWLGI